MAEEKLEMYVDDTPEYVAVKSMAALTGKIICGILFCWLLFIPTIKMIIAIMQAKAYSVEFYKDRIVQKAGVFNKTEKEQARTGNLSCSINKSFFGNMCNYGTVHINMLGKEDLILTGIKNPDEIKNYLKKSYVKGDSVKQVVHD